MALDFEKVDLGGFGINEDQGPLPTIETPLTATMSEAVKVNPDQQAHINKLSQQSGIPSFAVESDPAQVESKLNFDNINLSEMSKRSPNTAEYLVDFNNASIAHDDVTALEAIESVFDFGKTFENIGESISLGFESQVAGGVMTGMDKAPTRIEDIIPASALPIGMEQEAFAMSQQFASNFGINTDEELQTAKVEATDKMIGRLRELKSVKEKLQPEDLNLLEQGVRAGVESLANMAPGMGLMLLSGGQAAPMLATMGIQTFGASYADARAEGLDPQKAGWFAGIDAAIEVGTEVLPVGQLENIITGGTKGLGKKALKFMIKEMGTEQIATLGQTVNSYLFGLDETLEKAIDEKDFAKAAQIQIQRQAVTAIATLVAGGAQATIATGANKAINAMNSEETKKQQAYTVEQQNIDRLNDNSEKSKLKARDKESFKQFVEKADGENNTHVFIDASQVSLYLQTKTREEIENDTGLVLLDNQVREASALDGEVQIPVADFATELTGTEHFNQLRDSMTMSDQTVSPFRQEQEKQETAVYVRNLMAEAQGNLSQYVEAQDIYTTVRQQLVDSGRVTPQNATVMAQVVPAWATAQSVRSGKSVQQVYEESGLLIEGPLTGEQARLQDELSVFTQMPVVDLQSNITDQFEGLKLSITGTGNTVTLNKVIVPEEQRDTGVGTQVLDQVVSWADANGKTITLTPSEDFGGNVKRLKEFYKRAGFVENKGKNKDFEISESMYRVPQETERFEQPTSPDAKGSRGYYDPSNSLIRLTDASDMSTFLHEFAHFMYDMELNSNSDMVQSINGWYKRNSKSVAKEANRYIGREPGGLEQSATSEDLETFTQNFILDRMTEDLEGGQAYGSGYNAKFGESTKRSTDNVAWWQAKNIKKWINETGTDLVYSDLSNKKYFLNVISKIKTGKKLTDKQERVKQYVDHIAEKYLSEDTETVQNVEYAKLEREGFEFISPVTIPVGDITEGTQLLIIKENGSTEVLTNEGRKEKNGNIIFSSNITDAKTEVDEFDVIENVNGYPGDVTLEYKPSPLDDAAVPGPQGTVTPDDVRIFLDNKTTGDEAKDSAIRRAVHEQFARGFETYLMEGKAPSIELRNAFRTFARWLSQVYQALKGDLNVNLDPEMRQVFDRLLATEEQIAAAEARVRFEPMFTDAAMAGMTEEEFAKYQQQQSKIKDKQSETLRDKLIKQLTRQTQKWWKEEKQDIVDVEIDKLKKERVYIARSQLKDGNIKLDFATTKEMIGEEKTDKRGRTMVRVSPKLRGMTVKEKQGVHPDEAAALFGYGSGSEMLGDLINAPGIKEVAETRAEAVMVERHGDIMTDGTIERAADDAVQNEERGKLLLKELKTLSKDTTVPTIDRMTIKNIATERVGRLAFREIFPGKYRKAEIKAAQESTRMLAEGNRDGAAAAKMRQVMNYYLGMEATQAKADTMKIVDRMGRYNKKKVREEILKAEGGYLDQIDKILNRFEFRKAVSLKAVDDINSWVKERIETDGDALVLSNATLDEGYVTHWKNVPYSALNGINDSVKNIEHVARYANKITRMQEEVDFKKLVTQWVDSMNEKVKTRFKSARTDVVEGRNWGRWAMAQMTKIPFLASWLDGGERVGISHDILVQPFTDAYNAEIELWDLAAKPVMDAIANRSKADIKRHNQKIFITGINDSLYGHQIVAVALNTGNAGNLKKMLLGEGWADSEVETDISFDNRQLQSVLQHMTKSDWQLVQTIWDQMEVLYPQLAEVHRKTTGLTPPKVEAVPLTVGDIELRGGYYPVKYDPIRSHQAELNEEKLNAQTESMFSNTMSIQSSVNAGSTSERTGYYAPIRLSLDVVPSHFQETIHYITHHDAVRETNRLLRNQQVSQTIKEKLGPEEFAQLKPWLNSIAKDGRETPHKMFWDSILQRLRFGVTLGVMGFKASTGIIQVSGLSNTIAEVGNGSVLKAMRSILGSPKDMKEAYDFAVSNSKVMKHRANTMDREIKNAMRQLEDKRGVMAAVQEVSMKHIALVQTFAVDLPSWHAGYINELERSGDEAKAYQYADWLIENVQGSGATKDLAAIMRGQSETGRMFTMFMTFFSSLWNLERDLVKGAKSGLYSKTNVAAKAMFLFTIPVIFEMMMRDKLSGDDEPEEKLQQVLTAVAMFPIQSIPFVRDIANAATGEFGYNITPIQSLIEAGTRTIPKLVTNGFTDDEMTKGQIKGASKFIGAAVGVPGVNQMWSTGEHLYEVIEEGEDLTMQELLFGPKRDK